MMLAAIVMGSQVTLFAQEKKGAKSERRQFNKRADAGNNSAIQNYKRIGELDEPFLEYVSWGQPEGAGATTVAWFWGLMSIGCLLGLVIVKLIDSKLMLRIFSMIAIFNLAIALFGPTQVAIIAFACCGFSISIMFSVIFALALTPWISIMGLFPVSCVRVFSVGH